MQTNKPKKAIACNIIAGISVLLVMASCSTGSNKAKNGDDNDSCSVAKKFDSAEMNKKKIKPGYSGEVKYYLDKDSADIDSRHIYKDGRLIQSIYYYDNGNKRYEYSFRCGALHGEQKYYYENGSIEKVLPYSFGYRQGAGVFYYENGTVKLRVTYSHDSVAGAPQYYDEKGNALAATATNTIDSARKR
jgi:antitoxin component YwqK of YwqJK toxin-antitoxin module